MITSYQAGRATVETKTPFTDMARYAIEHIAPGVVPAMERELSTILYDARTLWPVRTGRSKDALRVQTEVRRDKVVVRIVNDVAYTRYIKWAGRYKLEEWQEKKQAAFKRVLFPVAPTEALQRKHVWTTLIRKPTQDASKTVAVECGNVVRRVLARRA